MGAGIGAGAQGVQDGRQAFALQAGLAQQLVQFRAQFEPRRVEVRQAGDGHAAADAGRQGVGLHRRQIRGHGDLLLEFEDLVQTSA